MHATRRPATETLDPDLVREIRQRNALDVALYEWVRPGAECEAVRFVREKGQSVFRYSSRLYMSRE